MTEKVQRVDVGTDVAMIGAWDANRDARPPDRAVNWAEALQRDVDEGHLFLIHTGADGGGPVDVYVDTEVPPKVLDGASALDGEFFLALPTGRMVVGGAEDYRAAKRRITDDNSVVGVPPGNYLLRCYVGPDEDQDDMPASEKELKARVGAENLRWYDRANGTIVVVGFAMLLQFPLLAVWLRWWIALAIALVVFFAYWHISAWLIRRSARYVELERVITPFRFAHAPPSFILELRAVADTTGLRGGSVHIVE
jgi:hypothetical protein